MKILDFSIRSIGIGYRSNEFSDIFVGLYKNDRENICVCVPITIWRKHSINIRMSLSENIIF